MITLDVFAVVGEEGENKILALSSNGNELLEFQQDGE